MKRAGISPWSARQATSRMPKKKSKVSSFEGHWQDATKKFRFSNCLSWDRCYTKSMNDQLEIQGDRREEMEQLQEAEACGFDHLSADERAEWETFLDQGDMDFPHHPADPFED